MFLFKNFYLVLFFGLSILLVSCGANEVIMKPKYDNKLYKEQILKRPNVLVVKVYDKRNNNFDSPFYAGYAKVGAFNKTVPYYIKDTVSNFVQKSVNAILGSKDGSEEIVPLTITIDTLKVYEVTGAFSEDAIFKCAMNFQYPVSADSMNIISTYSYRQERSMSDATSLLSDQIYHGIYDCTSQFVEKYDKGKSLMTSSANIPKIYTEEKAVPHIIKEKAYIENTSESNYKTFIGASYYGGDKVVPGYNVKYHTFNYKDSAQFINGFGLNLCVYNIKNPEANLKGTFVSFGGKYVPRYFFSESREGFYITGGLQLSCGSERIGDKSNFFFGPTLEEQLGVKLGAFILEGGLYQIFFWGSDLLPSDYGFTIGLGIQF